MASDPSVLNDVSLTDRTGFTTSVTPSYLPKAGQTARDLQIIFYPKWTVKNTKFVYDKSKWTVAVGNNVQFLTGTDIIEIVEDTVGAKAQIQHLPDQPGDVPRTCADISKARMLLGYNPRTSFEEGIRRTVKWYKNTFKHTEQFHRAPSTINIQNIC